MKKKTTMHLYLDNETYLELEQIANHKRVSKSQAISQLIQTHYETNYK